MKNKYAVLTGAGFSHNFGAPLASEMWSIIYNRKELDEHPNIREIMKKLEPEYDYNYEKLFYEICQNETKTINEEGQRAFKAAVYGAYDDIDIILQRYSGQYQRYSHEIDFADISAFLKSILGNEGGFFFTLNQDIFIERSLLKLCNDSDLHLSMPGISDINVDFDDMPLEKYNIKIPSKLQSITCEHNKINYIKLHGSCNWFREDTNDRLLVLGGKKEEAKQKDWLIKEYFDIFENTISEDINKLIIIGYGFMDDHINKVLLKGCERKNFELYVINNEPPKNMAERFSLAYNSEQNRLFRLTGQLTKEMMYSETSRRWDLFVNIRYHYPMPLKELFIKRANQQPCSSHLERFGKDLNLTINCKNTIADLVITEKIDI